MHYPECVHFTVIFEMEEDRSIITACKLGSIFVEADCFACRHYRKELPPCLPILPEQVFANDQDQPF